MRSLLFALLFLSAVPAVAQQKFDVNDVSFLFPVEPANKNPNYLLHLENEGRYGQLLSESLWGDLPMRNKLFYENWAVTAARFEPCTEGDKENPTKCTSELRLTAQPLIPGPHGYKIDLDGMHLIYGLDSQQTVKFLSRLRQLKNLSYVPTNGVPLGVHPALRGGGMETPFYKALIQLILDFTGENKLIRIAISKDSTIVWEFQGGVFQNGKFSLDPIPNLGRTTEMLFTFQEDDGLGTGSMSPEPETPASVLPLFEDSEEFERAIRDGSFFRPGNSYAAAAELAVKIENPMQGTHRLNTDCVSCHQAERFAGYAKSLFGRFQGNKPYPWSFETMKFNLPGYTLTNDTAFVDAPSITIAFGWAADKATIIQRVINESAIVADWMNRH